MERSVNEVERLLKALDSGMIRVAAVKHNNGNVCLFEVPDEIGTLNEGDRVLCDTIKGECEAIVIGGSCVVGKIPLNVMMRLTGAKSLPLKKIIGKYELKRI